MFNTIRRRVRRLAGRDESMARAHDATIQFRVPNPYGGRPWLTATVALSSTPHGYGETVRVRAHMDGALKLPVPGAERERLAHDRDGGGGLVRYGRDAAAALARGVVERLPARHLESIAARRWRSWVDIQMSTSPLDGGADALMPEPLRGMYGGGLPRAGTGEPRIGVWSGPAGGPAGGVAQLAMLQLDERDIGRDRQKSGTGFNLNASIAQVMEPTLPYGDGD
ncbi:hypothetical protein SADO_09297 [Salinisphaera dokdonensis CL-ES53]|uniref:Uncharacterized protein n=1 Tax=Salinisphaera dokdonensis CL-ES53 TaxID=1304272 RepID=A0ABV2B1N3_9GAMM